MERNADQYNRRLSTLLPRLALRWKLVLPEARLTGTSPAACPRRLHLVTLGRRQCCRVVSVTEGAREQSRGVGGMSRRTATWLEWSLGALSVAMFVAAVVLYFLTRSVQPPSSWGTGGLSAVLIFLLPFLAFPL